VAILQTPKDFRHSRVRGIVVSEETILSNSSASGVMALSRKAVENPVLRILLGMMLLLGCERSAFDG
jgi:hypothetical protein